MMKTTTRSLAVLMTVLISLSLTGSASAAGKGDYEQFKKEALAQKKQTIKLLTEQRAPAIVTVRYISKSSMFGRENKNEMETGGVMVSPDGMVLATNSGLQGMAGLMSQAAGMMGGMGMGIPKMQADVEDIRIMIGDDPEELEAELIGRDSDLDLAWIQIKDKENAPFSYVDLNDSADLGVGDGYYTISRMAERFDRVPVINSSSVAAKIVNPRPLVVGGAGSSGMVFTAEGKVAGFVITQAPEEGEQTVMSLDFATMFSGSALILPAPKVVKAMAQAKKLAKEKAEEAAEKETDEGDEEKEE